MRQLSSCCAIAVAIAVAIAACDEPATTIIDAATVDGRGSDGGGDGPVALPRTIDLGLGDCGGTATATAMVTNSGAADVDLAFASSDPAFTISPSPVTIIAGTSTTFTVTAAVPATVNAGVTLTATLTATTNIPGHATETVTVSATSRGAMFAVSPPSINFGAVLLGSHRDLTFVLSNTGNGPMNVGVRPLSNPDFAISFGTDNFADLAPGALVTGTATYTPGGTGSDMELAPLELGGGVRCGTPPTTLPLRGDGATTGTVLVQGGPIDFGPVACGATSGTATVTLMNTGTTPRAFTATLPTDAEGDEARYTVAPPTGTVPGNGMVTLTVTRLAIARPFAPRAVDATLRVVAGGAPIDVAIQQALRGPFLTTTTTAPIDFGYQLGESTTDATVELANTGTAMAALTSTATGAFSTVLAATIAAGGTDTGAIRYEPGSPGPVATTVTIDATGACSAPLTFQVAAGEGPYADIQPAATFASCPPPTSFSTSLAIFNPGTQALTVTCVEDTGAGASGLAPTFTPPTATVPAGGSASVTVDHAPGPAHAGALTAILACTTNEPLTNQRVSSLTRTLDGVDLVLTAPVPLDFTCNTSETKGFSTRNDGTQAAFLSPLLDLLYPLSAGFDFSTIAPGDETFHSITAYGGSGSGGFRLVGGGDACATATGSGGLLFAGSVGFGGGSSLCSVEPATLPVRVFDFTAIPN